MVKEEIDIVVIGGGLIGATFLLALNHLGYSTVLLEANAFEGKQEGVLDARSLALSPASQRILMQLGVWEQVQDKATPITTIHVSEQHHFGASRLHGTAQEPLGVVVEMHRLQAALYQALHAEKIQAPANVVSFDEKGRCVTVRLANQEMKQIKAKLFVACDGAHSAMRGFCGLGSETKLYQQEALVANIRLARPHRYWAYERFTQHGPLALLPLQGQQMSLVWALPPIEAQRLLQASEKTFLNALQDAFGYRLGRFVQAGQRVSFPLQQVIMPQQAKWPVVFVGNAAHTLHPVAGQGFNLGLRDVATLAQCSAKEGLSASMLHHYLQLRARDQSMITHFSDGLIQFFTNPLPGLGVFRGLGLMAFDNMPFLKKQLARYAQGFGGVVPDLVCEIALERPV